MLDEMCSVFYEGLLDLLSNESTVHFNVFSSFMEDWVSVIWIATLLWHYRVEDKCAGM